MSAKKPKKKAQKDGKKEFIKKEGEEMYPMTHYIDDRVELLKQIFSTLKPKTIKSLAPEFLKKSSIEEIEELCLNELLGISKKRLSSVINATECPTDTESSSDDSDVENVEEHISLEEISSDSEDGGSNRKAAGNKAKKRTNAKKPPDGENGHGMEISVLELLELQARARAIRSQLALEPVTKIEVDSGDDSADTKTNEEDKTNSSSSKSNKAPNESTSKSINGNKTVNGVEQHPPKRIKLKRNFRKANATSDNEETNTNNYGSRSDSKEENEKVEIPNRKKEPSPEIIEETSKRSPSPDVITILPSPETFCISDSSEDEHEKGKITQKKATARKTIEKYPSTFTESKQQKESEKIDKPKEPAEVEDGEIIDQEEDNKADQKSHNNTKAPEETSDISNHSYNNGKSIETADLSTESNEPNVPDTQIVSISENKISDTISNNKKEEQLKDNDDEVANTKSETIKTEILRNDDKSQDDSGHEDFEHNNDDVISLGGHDDLDYEMRDHLDDECIPSKNVSTSSSPVNAAVVSEGESINYKNDDIIDLHDDDTTDEDESSRSNKNDQQTQNWNTRWLTSSKVSKIMATSRLGNRLREKIKSKKTEQILRDSETPPKTPEPIFESKFEEGSVEQYNEILDREN